jgi:sugar lactone lactonase YvrE
MYFIDTHAWSVDALDFDPETGEATNRRKLIVIDPKDGAPDGLIVDAEGCIWVALWEGWAVRRYAPDGTLLMTVDVPVARVTKPAFGGHDLDDLYITTASPPEPDDAQPHAGGLFKVRPGVRGLPVNSYAG